MLGNPLRTANLKMGSQWDYAGEFLCEWVPPLLDALHLSILRPQLEALRMRTRPWETFQKPCMGLDRKMLNPHTAKSLNSMFRKQMFLITCGTRGGWKNKGNCADRAWQKWRTSLSATPT